jgi:hypothetical protein
LSSNGQRLFDLLPAIYRLRDAQFAQSTNALTASDKAELEKLQSLPSPLTPTQQQQFDLLTGKANRGPQQSLLMLIEEQLAVIAENLDQLYDDQFIETCAPWVIPYIGDLIGYRPIHGVAPAVASPRAEVGHTVSLRRRKGTALVLEQLARDVTGWGAHAVEFFKLLAATQYMNHIRLYNHYAPNLRDWRAGEYMETGFDATAHKVDVRRIAIQRGRYNIKNIGIFLWTLNAYSLTKAPAAPVGKSAQCFRFNSLGRDMPLFNYPVSQGSEITAPAMPQNVPDILRRRVLCNDRPQTTNKDVLPVYYGLGKSLTLYIDEKPLEFSAIRVCNLSGDDGHWNNVPEAGIEYLAAIDPELGRIALAPSEVASPPHTTNIKVSYYYGFNGEMGGGEYPRADTFTASAEQRVVRVPGDRSTISDALTVLAGDGVVEICDSGNYVEPSGLTIAARSKGHVEVRAADGFRPTLTLGGEIAITGGPESLVALNGLVINYSPPSIGASLPPALICVPDQSSNRLSQLTLSHCTLVPGWSLMPDGDSNPAYSDRPILAAEAPAGLRVVIEKSIVGGLWVSHQATAEISDSVVDATDSAGVAYVANVDPMTGRPKAGGALTLQGCTVIGKIYASLLSLVSNCIVWASPPESALFGSPPSIPAWNASLWADRKQEGCVRFSYLPAASLTPRRFSCVEQQEGSPQPLFFSLRYGDPAYAKIAATTDDLIRRGADDGGEMGAFHFLLAPLRENDLRVRLREYMPVGLEFGIFYQT